MAEQFGATMGNAIVAEAPRGYVSEAFIRKREEAGIWVPAPRDKLVVDGCGDDRHPTTESAKSIDSQTPQNTLSLDEGQVSIFGSTAGKAKTFIGAGAAVHGIKFIQDIGGFEGAMEKLIDKQRALATVHSAESNEGNPAELCRHGNIGCAYCLNLGATAFYLSDLSSNPDASDADRAIAEDLREVVRTDQEVVFGSDRYVDAILQANQLIAEDIATRHGAANTFAINRPEYLSYRKRGVSVAILEGKHLAPSKTAVMTNFSLDEVGSPRRANEAGLGIYRVDAARAALSIGSLLKEYDIPPEVYLRTVQADTVPVRAVLGDANMNPRALPMGYRGNPQAAIRELDALLGR